MTMLMPMMQDANDDRQFMIVLGSLVDKPNEPKTTKEQYFEQKENIFSK